MKLDGPIHGTHVAAQQVEGGWILTFRGQQVGPVYRHWIEARDAAVVWRRA